MYNLPKQFLDILKPVTKQKSTHSPAKKRGSSNTHNTSGNKDKDVKRDDINDNIDTLFMLEFGFPLTFGEENVVKYECRGVVAG